jgi:hypothetical protein
MLGNCKAWKSSGHAHSGLHSIGCSQSWRVLLFPGSSSTEAASCEKGMSLWNTFIWNL